MYVGLIVISAFQPTVSLCIIGTTPNLDERTETVRLVVANVREDVGLDVSSGTEILIGVFGPIAFEANDLSDLGSKFESTRNAQRIVYSVAVTSSARLISRSISSMIASRSRPGSSNSRGRSW